MRQTPWLWLPVAAISSSAYATTYLTVEQAQKAIFPDGKLTPAFITLKDDQARLITTMSGVSVSQKEIKVWKVANGGWFILDNVIGKHEVIAYAVGLNNDGSVKQVEIMDYKESYGYEVRNANWRKQFIGKTVADPVKLDRDIRNISGATLSSRHVTEGIKRILATYATVLK